MGRRRRDKTPGPLRLWGSHALFALFRLIALLPARPTVALFGGIGSLAARFGLLRHKIVTENIAIAFGESMSADERRRVEIASGGHLFMMLAETIFIAFRPPDWARSTVVEVVGEEHLDAHAARGTGIVSFGGHFGNWEVFGAYRGQERFRARPVAKELHDPVWQARTLAMRRKFGVEPIHVGPGALKEAMGALKEGRAVNFLIDQDMGPEGLFVPFFGKLASTLTTPAALALKTGCPIQPSFIVRLGPARHRIELKTPIDPATFTGTREERIAAIMLRMTQEVEDMVRLHPAQYFWVHRRWRTTPEAAAKRLASLAEKRIAKLEKARLKAERKRAKNESAKT